MVRLGRAAALAVGCCISGFPAIAAETWWGPVLVSDPPAAPQFAGEGLALDPAGNFTAVWEEDLELSYSAIYLRRLSPGGTPLGPPVQANASVGLHAVPFIAAGSEGDFVVAWLSSPTRSPSDFQFVTRRFAASGEPLGPEMAVTPPGVGAPRVGGNRNGDYVLSWTQDGTTRAQVFDAASQPLSVPFEVAGLGTPFGVDLTDARQVVAASITPAGALLQCFSSSGDSVSPATLVAADALADPNTASLAVLPDGAVVLGWAETAVLNAVRLRKVAPDCTTPQWVADVNVAAGSVGAMGDVTVVASSTGEHVGVSWVTQEIARYSTYARSFTADGVAASEPHLLATAQLIVTPAQMALDATGAIAAVWTQTGFTHEETLTDVYAAGTGQDPGTCDAEDYAATEVTPQVNTNGNKVMLKATVDSGDCGSTEQKVMLH